MPQPLLNKCSYLNDYSTLVEKIKEGINLELSQRDAISCAVKFCLEHGIMKNYLIEHSEDVFNMLALEWNMNNALLARFQDGLQQGKNLKAKAVAIKMLRRGRPLQEMHEDTDLPMERIHQLTKGLHWKLIMNDSERKNSVKKFTERWAKHGYEKGEAQPFWSSLLHDVLSVPQPEKFIRFEMTSNLPSFVLFKTKKK